MLALDARAGVILCAPSKSNAKSSARANNHARVGVAYTRDGATWTLRTPHETADAGTVDRFHPWLGVAPDGKVYVMFYDTRRRSPSRSPAAAACCKTGAPVGQPTAPGRGAPGDLDALPEPAASRPYRQPSTTLRSLRMRRKL